MEVRLATQQDMQEIYALRFEVFVNEQKVPRELELDEHDPTAIHIIASNNNIAIGCARIILSEIDAHIGRLAVKSSCRSKGVGTEICKFAIEYCRQNGYNSIWLNSQIQAIEFYKRLGFIQVGESFTEAGIEHIKMQITEHPISL